MASDAKTVARDYADYAVSINETDMPRGVTLVRTLG